MTNLFISEDILIKTHALLLQYDVNKELNTNYHSRYIKSHTPYDKATLKRHNLSDTMDKKHISEILYKRKPWFTSILCCFFIFLRAIWSQVECSQ